MPFRHERVIRIGDTDAAGVVFFPNYLVLCHEAYEEALAAAGVDVRAYFSAATGLVVPIARSEADYLRPLHVGDRVRIVIAPTRLDESRFALDCEIVRLGPPEKRAARVRTEHVCITTGTRQRSPLPEALAAWIARGGD